MDKNTHTSARFVFLGTGASNGVPVIGCKCPVCTSGDLKNRRFRASMMVEFGNRRYLIDAGPDIRQQLLLYNITAIDGLLLTHTHYDHIGGLEEMRIFTFLQKKAVPCLVSHKHYEQIQKLYYYLFEEDGPIKNVTAKFDFTVLDEAAGTLSFEGLPLHYFSYRQGTMPVLGYRFGSLAYVTDIKEYSDDIFTYLESVETLIISALRFDPSRIQFSVDEAIAFAEKVGAKNTYFMHMSHDVSYDALTEYLPKGMQPAYDGLRIDFSL